MRYIQRVFDTELIATVRIYQNKLLEKSLLKSITFESKVLLLSQKYYF